MELIKEYIKDKILRSGEEIEWDLQTENNTLIDCKIVKHTKRRYRVVGLITISNQTMQQEDVIDPILDSLHLTARKKLQLNDDDSQTFKWLEGGWILKEVRFEQDEKTVKESHYRMGLRLSHYINERERMRLNEIIDEFNHIKLDFSLINEEHDSSQRGKALKNSKCILERQHSKELVTSSDFPRNWSVSKRIKFLRFTYAFFQISFHKTTFDWKEIGAAYYKEIGGSKKFDANKEVFLELLEEWTETPIVELGLASLGQITPIYFSGEMSGKYSRFHWGPVHALTNLSIVNEELQTDAKTLWVVENRAILTRIAAEPHFLQREESMIICVDGHLRSAHKHVLSQVVANSNIKQVIIWCDYDIDGLHISKGIYRVIGNASPCQVKWLLPNGQVVKTMEQFEQIISTYLQKNEMEQEQVLGEEKQWREWILA